MSDEEFNYWLVIFLLAVLISAVLTAASYATEPDDPNWPALIAQLTAGDDPMVLEMEANVRALATIWLQPWSATWTNQADPNDTGTVHFRVNMRDFAAIANNDPNLLKRTVIVGVSRDLF